MAHKLSSESAVYIWEECLKLSKAVLSQATLLKDSIGYGLKCSDSDFGCLCYACMGRSWPALAELLLCEVPQVAVHCEKCDDSDGGEETSHGRLPPARLFFHDCFVNVGINDKE